MKRIATSRYICFQMYLSLAIAKEMRVKEENLGAGAFASYRNVWVLMVWYGTNLGSIITVKCLVSINKTEEAHLIWQLYRKPWDDGMWWIIGGLYQWVYIFGRITKRENKKEFIFVIFQWGGRERRMWHFWRNISNFKV